MYEQFMVIPGYDMNYWVSNFGRIVSTFKQRRVIRSTGLSGAGYLCLALNRDGKKRMHNVHRIVAEVFVKGRKAGLEVNHKNGIKTDNRAENLEWVTPKENMRHAKNLGLTRLTKAKKSNLPLHISRHSSGFQVQITRPGGRYGGWFSKLEDAIKRREEILKELS